MLNKRYTILLLWGLTLIISLAWLIINANKYLRTDLTMFIPAAHTDEQRQLLDLVRNGPASRLILIAISGGSSVNRAQLSQSLITQLTPNPLFNLISNGNNNVANHNWRQLFQYRYLLSPQINSEHFSEANLHTALQIRLQELASPLSSLYSRILPHDPTGEILAFEQIMRPIHQPHNTNGVWSTVDGTQALLIAQTHASGFDLDAQEQAVTAINKAFATANIQKQFTMQLSGPGAYGVLSRQIIQTESASLTFIASILVISIVYFGYRSFKLIFLSTLPVISGLIIGAIVVIFWFGSIHGITLAFSITLLDIAVDYPIHAFSHQLPGETLNETLQRIWPTLKLGIITTIIAYTSMLTTDFAGLSQLGIYTMTGLTTAAIVTRWGLPLLIDHCENNIVITEIFITNSNFRYTFNTWSIQQIRLIQITLIAMTIASCYWIWLQQGQIWEDDLAALSPIPKELITQDRWLRQQLNAPEVGRLLLIRANSAEQALQRTEQLKPILNHLSSINVITGTELVTNYLPSQKMQRERQTNLPDSQVLQDRLQRALYGLPFRTQIFDPFIEDVIASKTLLPITPAMVQGTPLGARITPLLQTTDSSWLSLVPLIGVKDEMQLKRAFINQIGVQYIDLKQETNKLIAQFRNTTLLRLWIGLVTLVSVLLIYLRSLKQVMRVMRPVIMALIIDIALLLFLGQKLTMFHLISLLLVVGVSLDYSLFVNHTHNDVQETRHTQHALTLCLATTITAFGLLSSSALPVLQAIGITVTIGVIGSYIAAFAFMTRNKVNI